MRTISATGEVLSLEKEAERERLFVDDRIKLDDQKLRSRTTIGFVGVFIIGDVLTLAALAYLGWLDQLNIEQRLIKAGERIVNTQVIMTLLAATTVQVGAISIIIA